MGGNIIVVGDANISAMATLLSVAEVADTRTLFTKDGVLDIVV